MVQALPADQDPTSRKKVAIGLWAVFTAYFAFYFFINGINIAQPKMVEEFNGMALFAWLIALPERVHVDYGKVLAFEHNLQFLDRYQAIAALCDTYFLSHLHCRLVGDERKQTDAG